MATKIEVHFEDSSGKTRQAVVTPGSGVRAIFLDASDAEQTLGKKAKKQRPPEGSVSIVGEDTDAKIGVCYMVGGDLFCW